MVSERHLQYLRQTLALYEKPHPVALSENSALDQREKIRALSPSPSVIQQFGHSQPITVNATTIGFFARKENDSAPELNPLSSSTSFFVTDSSGRQRK